MELNALYGTTGTRTHLFHMGTTCILSNFRDKILKRVLIKFKLQLIFAIIWLYFHLKIQVLVRTILV